VANSTSLQVSGVGIVVFRCRRPRSDDYTLRLSDVYFAPDCPVNLVFRYLLRMLDIYFDGRTNILRSMVDSSLVAEMPYHGRFNRFTLADELVFTLVDETQERLLIWHKRLGYALVPAMARISEAVRGIPKINSKDKLPPCEACALLKSKKVVSRAPNPRAIKVGDRIHVDTFGLVTPVGINGEKYGLIVVDQRSRGR
jgi:hypothetical protein